MGKMLLIATDAFSKWPEVIIMTNTSSSKTIAALREMFARNGIPRELVSDNGPQFVSHEFQLFTHNNGIRHIRSSPYHPASNGAAERVVQTVKRALTAGEKDGLSMEQALAVFLLRYRNTPHATTGTAPSWLFLHRSLRTRLDLLRPDVGEHVRRNQEQQKAYHDRRSHFRSFTIGQNVWVNNFRQGPRWVKGVIVDSLGPSSYLIRMSSGEMWRRHVDHIRGGRNQPHEESDEERTSEQETELADPGDDVNSAEPGTNQPADSLSSSAGSPGPAPPPSVSLPTAMDRRYPSRDRQPPDRLYARIEL